MPPVGLTQQERMGAIAELSKALLPLVKNDAGKARSYAMQVESKLFESTPTREVWLQKFNVKLKGVQAKVQAQQQNAGAPAPPLQHQHQQPGAYQQPILAQQNVAAQQQMQAQAFHQQQQQQQQPAPHMVRQMGGMPPAVYAQHQQQQAVAAQVGQQFMVQQQGPHAQAQRPPLQGMPSFNDPAFQQLAKAFLDPDESGSAQGPQQMGMSMAHQQAHQAHAAAQAHAQAAHQQAMLARQQQLAQAQQQQQLAAQQAAQQQQLAAQQAAQQQQLAAQQAAQQQAAQQAAQQQALLRQQQLAAQQQALAAQQAQQQQQALAAQQAQYGQMGTGGMMMQPGMGGMPQQLASQQAQQQQAAMMMRAGQLPPGAGFGQPGSLAPPEQTVATPQLVPEYRQLQRAAQENLANDAREMLQYFRQTPGSDQEAMQRRIKSLTRVLHLIQEPVQVVSPAQLHQLRGTIETLQKDVHKFRTYMAKHKAKVGEVQSSLGGSSLPSLQGGSQVSAGVFSGGTYSLPQSVAPPHQQQVLPGLPPGLPQVLPPQQVVGAGGMAHSPYQGSTAAQSPHAMELMDESQPVLAATPPGGPPTGASIARSSSSSLLPTSRALPPSGPAAGTGAAAAMRRPASAAAASPSAAARRDGVTDAQRQALLQQQQARQQRGATSGAAPAAVAAAAGAARPAQLPSAASREMPLDPTDRLLLCLEKRGQGDLDAAAAGVRRLLQQADAAVPTPPLPREALRLDGWPQEALDVLCQSPQSVLSRPVGAASAAQSAGAGEAPPPAKRARVAGAGGGADAAADAAWGELRARVAGECGGVEGKVAAVALSPGAAPEPDGSLLVTCQWRDAPPAAAEGGTTPQPLPDWKRLSLRLGPGYPAEPPTPVFPGKPQPAGVAAALANVVKDALCESLMALPGPPSLDAVVGAWAEAVGAVCRQAAAS